MAPNETNGVSHLVLVRHGESNATVDRVVGGIKGCRGLSPLGIRQAEALRERWAATGEVQADVLMASCLPRARETAEIIAPALGDLPVEVDDDLSELLPGDSDGITWDEFVRVYGDYDPEAEPYRPLSPGGESYAEFLLRVGRTLHRLADTHVGRTAVVACHGGVIDGSLACFLGLPTQRPPAYDLRTRNTSVTEWELHRREGRASRWRLLRYNDTAHLAGL